MKRSVLITTLAILATCNGAVSTSHGAKNNESEGKSSRTLGRPDHQFDRELTVDATCGTDDSSSCSDGEYCHREPGSCNGPGVCKDPPEVCTMDYTPVCGCDGKTHSNRCAVGWKRTSVAFEGECSSKSEEGGWWSEFTNLSPAPIQTTRDAHSGALIVESSISSLLCILSLSSIALIWSC
jgi:hypothetical protein